MAEEAPSGGERTEEPTSKRRHDFRQKGQVAQSKEVHNAALITFSLLFWLFYMPTFFKKIVELLKKLFSDSILVQLDPAGVMELAFFLFQQMAVLLFPLFLFLFAVGILSSYLQIGWAFSTHPLMFNFSKFNPVQGFKKILSKQSIMDLLKSLAKVIFVGYLAYSTVVDQFEKALILPDMPPYATLEFLAKAAVLIFAKVSAALILIAFIDFLYVRWDMEQKMKMTKQEVREEYKETEGDPKIKAQIRAIQREMAKRRMMSEVPKADVIITNPTHISIAVKYVASEMDAPIIVAKGTDKVALNIREIAKKNDVPIVENPPVARLLHTLELGSNIPENMFKAVAEILAYVYNLKKGKKKQWR